MAAGTVSKAVAAAVAAYGAVLLTIAAGPTDWTCPAIARRAGRAARQRADGVADTALTRFGPRGTTIQSCGHTVGSDRAGPATGRSTAGSRPRTTTGSHPNVIRGYAA